MAFRISLEGETKETVDRDQFAPAGWYKTVLDDASENGETGDLELTFEITAGLYKGIKFTEKLRNPEYAEDEDKAKAAAKKAKIWAGRMNAIKDEDFGKPDAEPDFLACIGNEYVVQTETREFTGKGGAQKKFTGPTYAGVYPPDHETIPDAVRAELKLPPARKKAGGEGAGNDAGRKAGPAGPGPKAPNGHAGGVRKEVVDTL